MIQKNIIFLFTFLFSIAAYGETVEKILIQGNERIEDSTIKSYVDITPGAFFNGENIDTSLKNLYNTQLFQKVDIYVKDRTLFIKVLENPKINLVVFEGNSKIKTKDLEAEVVLKPRGIYTKAKVQEDVNSIIELYNKNGRFSARVIPQIISLPQNRVNLIYKIEEGPIAKIEKIKFIGNSSFSDSRLESEISSKETHWYYFLSNSDKFNPSRIEYDRELLTRFYQSRGFADFKIISIITNISSRKERFYITITIDEGDRYDFGQIDIVSELKDSSIKVEDLKSEIMTEPKDLYDVRKIEKSVDKIIKKINDQGYAFVDVDPEVTLDQEKKLVNVTYHVGESRRVYINKIHIKGNVRTADKVIRREFRLSEGDPYNTTKITRSEQRINNLDFFEKANIETLRTSDPDKVDLSLKVQEKPTSSINIAGGYSTSDGPLARVGFNEPNLLGNGQDLSLSFMRSESRFDADTSFTEPYLFDMPLAGTVRLFTTNSERSSKYNKGFDNNTNGIMFILGYSLTEFLRHQVYYSFSKNKIGNIPSDAGEDLKNQVGTKDTSMIGHSLTYNKLDSNHNPTYGYILSFHEDFAGLGGDTKFIRHVIKSRYYHPIINDDIIFTIGAEVGNIKGLGGENVGINDRFSLGGNNLRGFRYAGAGPRTRDGQSYLGGNNYYTGSSEIKFPLGIGKEMGLFGSVFVDTGTLYKVDVADEDEILDNRAIRSSYGVGVGIASPMGPIRIHYAVPINKSFFDKEKNFDILFSTVF